MGLVASDGGSTTTPPARVAELAEACVRYVERALGVRLDYEPETLPLLDHWLASARGGSALEVSSIVAHASGAYFGEVVRRRYASWWAILGEDPSAWQVQLESTYLSLRPVEVAALALRPVEPDEGLDEVAAGVELALLELDEDDRPAVAARLAELPPVTEEEYRSMATLLEVIDIAVDAARRRRLVAGEPELPLEPDDYRT
jgi:hypothetical protein